MNINGVYYRLKGFIRQKQIQRRGSAKDYADKLKKYEGFPLLSAEEANKFLADKIKSGEAFVAGRFGSTELLNMRSYDFGGFVGQKYDENFHFNHLCEWSGFFPNDKKFLPDFVNTMKDACKQVDFLAVWFQPFEDYYIKYSMPQLKALSYLLDFEPWSGNDNHWSSALKGKKVLVIHPFDKTIQSQYKNRKNIFPADILPEFELKTLKAVQTLAGTKDDRFETWFDALEWMYKEAMKIDFEIAIIGCGAYGLPLAVKLKQAGKQAIHLAGATQLLFGIKGKRWEKNEAFEYVRKYFNNAWVYPSDEDRLTNQNIIEGGCYWK